MSFNRRIAQLVEHRPYKARVTGSSPVPPIYIFEEMVILLDQIEFKKRFFEVNFLPNLNSLKASIERVGIVSPLRVRRGPEEKYEIISGFRRYTCAKELGILKIPVIIEEGSDLQLFGHVIEENLFSRQLNLIEKGMVLRKLHIDFNLPEAQIIKMMPILDLAPSKKIFSTYDKLLASPPELKSYLVTHQYPLHIAEDFLRFDERDQKIWVSYLNEIRFSLSNLKDCLIGSHEITLRDRISLKELLSKVFEGVGDASVVKERLRRYRYPRLWALEEKFLDLKKKLNLPLEPQSSFFEYDKSQMKIQFNQRKGFENWIEKRTVAKDMKEIDDY